jgi:hypothetical protein
MVPSVVTGGGAGGGILSGAAAAAVQDSEFTPAPQARDIAFGCQFHMTDPGNEGSMISGLSGVSGISSLTDPSLLGGTSTSMRGGVVSRCPQLNQLRQQLSAQNLGNRLQTDGTATHMLLSSQYGLVNSDIGTPHTSSSYATCSSAAKCSPHVNRGDQNAIKTVGQAMREDQLLDVREDVHPGSLLPQESSPQQPVVTSTKGGGSARSTITGKDSFSGAAATAVQGSEVVSAPQARGIAFGCHFLKTDLGEESSMTSGLSFLPSGVSGMSTVTDTSKLSGASSFLSDPSALNETSGSIRGVVVPNSLRVSQLNQLRQQWTVQSHVVNLHHTGMLVTFQVSETFEKGSRDNPYPPAPSFQDVPSVSDAMSWAEHSLAGTGVTETATKMTSSTPPFSGAPHAHHFGDCASFADSSATQQSASGQQSLFGASMSVGSYSMSSKDDFWIGVGRSGCLLQHRRQRSRPDLHAAANEDRSWGASCSRTTTAAHLNTIVRMEEIGGGSSVHSGCDESVSMHSLLSNLSASLIALDLAEPRASSLLDHS